MRLEEVANRLSCALDGDGTIEIGGVATLESARAGDLSFLTNVKYYAEAKKTAASAIIVSNDCPPLGRSLLRHDNPYLAFARAVEVFHARATRRPFIHPTAWVSDSAVLGKDVSIDAFSYVSDGVVLGDGVRLGSHCVIERSARVGDATVIHSGSVILEGVVVGRRCIIQSNAVVGSDGFGYAKVEDGTWYRILQSGRVVLGDDVEIGAGTTIDRATLGETRVDDGTKLDNLVHIGHGCSVGRNTLLCAQVGLAGSTKVGSNVILAGQVGSAGHLSIGDGAMVTAQAGIPSDVEAGTAVSGSPAFEHKTWLRACKAFERLPELKRSLRDLERRITDLEKYSKEIAEQSRGS